METFMCICKYYAVKAIHNAYSMYNYRIVVEYMLRKIKSTVYTN